MMGVYVEDLRKPRTCECCPIRITFCTCGCDMDHCMISSDSQWISAAERLPDEYGEYLVLWKPRKEGIFPKGKLFYEIAEFEMDYNGIDGEWISEIPQSAPAGGYEVIYWMNLPSEPQVKI